MRSRSKAVATLDKIRGLCTVARKPDLATALNRMQGCMNCPGPATGPRLTWTCAAAAPLRRPCSTLRSLSNWGSHERLHLLPVLADCGQLPRHVFCTASMTSRLWAATRHWTGGLRKNDWRAATPTLEWLVLPQTPIATSRPHCPLLCGLAGAGTGRRRSCHGHDLVHWHCPCWHRGVVLL
jgi:hypothetical protein